MPRDPFLTVALILALAVAALPLAERPAYAQIGGGGLTAVVNDQSNKAVADALVVITDLARQTTWTLLTSSDGGFTASGLAPGTYRVDISHDGFRPLARQPIQVRTGETVRLDGVVLQVGAGGESVTVVGDASRLRSNGTLKQVIPQESIESIPLNGRNFLSLTTLSAGVALPPGSNQFPRINGGRPRTNEYLFDGISVLQPEPGQVAFFPVVDAIQEFAVVNNSAPAEYGRFNGGVVNLTTRAGTNRMHGTVFEFLRNEALNARNYFQSSDPVKPEFRRNQFGGTMGGPVRQNRAFFFADYQGQRQNVARTVFANVPTELQRQGIFTEPIGGKVVPIYDPASLTTNGSGGFTRTQFPDNTVPKEKMDPVAVALLDRYPHPTTSGMANNYRRTAIEGDDQDQVDGRVDASLGRGSQMFVPVSRFSGQFDPVTPLPDGSGTAFGSVLGPQNTTAWSTAGAYQRSLSPRLWNELRVGDTRRSVDCLAAPANGFVTPGIPTTSEFADMLPAFAITNYTQLGLPLSTATDFNTSVTEVADSFLWTKGRHSLKSGFDLRWERLNVVSPPFPTGQFTFNSFFTDLPGTSGTGNPLASFLTGQVANFQIDLQQSRIRNRAHIEEYFIQDDWRLSDRWTVSPGLRYTLNFPSTELDDQAAVFNPDTQQIEYLGRDGNPSAARRLDKANFGPRLGVADRITDRTVVSSAYGRVYIEQAGITTPFTTPAFPFIQTVLQRTLDNRTPAFVLAQGPTITPVGLTPDAGLGQGVFFVNQDRRSGYAEQWNVAVQHEITRKMMVEVAYVGSRITNVGMPDPNYNQLTVEQLALGPTLQEKVPGILYFGQIPRSSSIGDPEITRAQLMKPFPEYLTVAAYRDNRGRTSYKGMTLRLEQRMARGIGWSASYTRSKLIDEASSVFDASIQTGPQTTSPVADTFNQERDRDYSTGDIPHVFTASVVWNLPAGRGRSYDPKGILGALARDWTMSAVITAQSGVPIPVTQANQNLFAGFTTQRPNLLKDPELPADQRNANHWFDTTAFQQAPVFTLGSASRNPVRGPAYQNIDLAFARNLPLAGKGVELRAEVFNLMNSVQLGAPNGTVGNTAFGTIITAFDPRVIQLAVKVKF